MKQYMVLMVLWAGVYGNLPPSFTADMNLHVVNEDTPVGASIYTLKAVDPEGSPVRFLLSGTDRLSVDSTSGVVTVIKLLDREEQDTLRLAITAEDVVSGSENNLVRVPISVIIVDTNDNAPVFLQTPYETSVLEDAALGSTVLPGVRLSDKDQVGEILHVTCHAVAEENDEDCSAFELKIEETTSSHLSASLVLRRPLSYKQKKDYTLHLLATDGVQTSHAIVKIRVQDVQNNPPVFTGSTSGIVNEDDPIGTLVMRVNAQDGDTGAPRPVKFSLIQNPHDFFRIDINTGEIRTAKPLDREALTSPDGLIRVRVKAFEVARNAPVGTTDSETVVELTVTIRDVNDEAPTFSHREYHVSVPENVPDGTPLPNLDMFVQDRDAGSNSVFSLRLADSSGVFAVEPPVASGSTSVSVRVVRGPLDYEDPSGRKFLLQVVAEETLTASGKKLSSTATVIVTLEDTNDNAPTFAQEAYTAVVSESATPGTVVATITATDRDSGPYGTDGIQYSLFGNGADKFNVDSETATVTVAACESPGLGNCLDYEERPTYYLSLRATDNSGLGHATVVPVRVTLADSNDNPPRFTQPEYRAVIDENESHFDPPLVVQALDADTTSSIRYSLQSGDLTHLFSIDASSGQIRLVNASGLDISLLKTDTIVLTVEASDGLGSHAANVRILIRDANNNLPIFGKMSYAASVQENAPQGSVVEQVTASDADTGMNAQIVYRIHRGGFDDFNIDDATGVVSVARKLDFDMRQVYNIEVVASDKGSPPQSGMATLVVTVIDNNDKNPHFTPSTQRTQLREDTEPGTVFYQLVASDPDIEDSQDGLSFELESVIAVVSSEGHPLEGVQADQQFLNTFQIDQTSGNVSLTGQLDRGLASEITLSVKVTDTTAEPAVQVGIGTLVVTIVDVNDFPPIFSAPWTAENPSISLTLPEETPIGSLLTALKATDIDSSIAGYALIEPSSHFALDNTTGAVTVAGRLDYETIPQYKFVVVAWDTGLPTLSATVTVHVQLENINDEEPNFVLPLYEAKVWENSPVGTVVITVSAVDIDEGPFGVLTYSLTGTHSKHFSIDSHGQVTVVSAELLDREKVNRIVLRVVATDGGAEGQRHQTSVPLHITITDINDNGPSFSQSLYSATVVENLSLEPPAPVVQVTAHDADVGINAFVVYGIVDGNEQAVFHLDNLTGILYPARALNVSVSKYQLTIEARDMNGTGDHSDTTKVEITVLKQNEYKPRFIFPTPLNATVFVKENDETAEKEIMTVKAEDRDQGHNGELRYYLRVGEENINDTPEFHLDSITGVLMSKVVFDREEVNKYELVLVAKDGGSPLSHETLRLLTVIIQDDDDHRPQFPRSKLVDGYRFSLVENSPHNTVIGQLKADDPDDGANGNVFYHIVGGNTFNTFFLDTAHGRLYTAGMVDREVKAQYRLVIKATNDPKYESAVDGTSDNGVVYDVADASLASVVIDIDDVNDSPPIFPREIYYAGVSYDAEIDQFMRVISAKDDDEGINGSLIYAIRASNLYKPGETKAIGSIIPSPFNVSLGRLVTSSLMLQYRHHRFVLDVNAREESPPHRVAKCQVHVWVWERQDLVRVVVGQPPENVVVRQDDLAVALSQAARGSVVVDEVRYHVAADSSVNRLWTDVIIHVINESLQVMPVEEVVQRLDLGYATLTRNQEAAHVRHVYPAYVDAVTEEVDARLAGLVSLLAVLVVGFVSFIVVCCCVRYWVLSPAGRSQENLVSKQTADDDLGLNTTENPLWVEQKLKIYEEQELTMQVTGEFDLSSGGGSGNNTLPHASSVTVDAEWNANIDDPAQAEQQSNAYATIQKSHGGTLRSMQLRGLQQALVLGHESADGNDYATLDHLRRPSSHRTAEEALDCMISSFESDLAKPKKRSRRQLETNRLNGNRSMRSEAVLLSERI